ncbi:MAG TPA: hypothetical protein VHW73_07985 [Rudaea sp.]|jgi:uncharacterized membrane protein|nr:hypothetical protein [Rudaea sp.]
MIRAVGWLCVVALAIGAHWFDSDILRGACAAAVLALLAITAPPSLRISLGVIAFVAIATVLIFGSSSFFDVLPALIAAFVAYLFGRTLLPKRRPLIARAIVSIDGPQWLDDPSVVRYARRLTWVWTMYQTLLAIIALCAALTARGFFPAVSGMMPSPRLFGAILPVAVALLFVVEFAMRPFLIPQAPRHGLISFARRLILAWPALLDNSFDTPQARIP